MLRARWRTTALVSAALAVTTFSVRRSSWVCGRSPDAVCREEIGPSATNDVSVIDLARALQGKTDAEIGRIPMQVGLWGITATPDRRHIEVVVPNVRANNVSIVNIERALAILAGAWSPLRHRPPVAHRRRHSNRVGHKLYAIAIVQR
jgi:hypothetical protein